MPMVICSRPTWYGQRPKRVPSAATMNQITEKMDTAREKAANFMRQPALGVEVASVMMKSPGSGLCSGLPRDIRRSGLKDTPLSQMVLTRPFLHVLCPARMSASGDLAGRVRPGRTRWNSLPFGEARGIRTGRTRGGILIMPFGPPVL